MADEDKDIDEDYDIAKDEDDEDEDDGYLFICVWFLFYAPCIKMLGVGRY